MDYKELQAKYTEVISKRTETAKTFYKGDNKYCLAAGSTPIHYEENGEWYDIDITISNNKITKAPFTAEILTDAIGYSIISKKDGKRIDVKLDKIGVDSVDYVEPTNIEKNIVKWENLATDFDLVIEFRPRRVRVWKIIKSDKASKEVTFRVFEDVEGLDLRTVENVIGFDSQKRQTQSTRIVNDIRTFKPVDKDVKEYTIVETFENKVIDRDGVTRKRTLIENVEYPVSIDADIEVGIAAGADDGNDYKTTTTTPGTTIWQSYLTNNDNNLGIGDFSFNPTGGVTIKTRSESFMRFDGITIPLSSTIDDATLKTYHTTSGPLQSAKIYAFDENDPVAPTTGSTGALINKTTGIASNVVTDSFITAAGYTLNDIDIKSIVQELVNSYAYSNEAMLFFMRPVGLATTFEAINIYAYDQGTTKDPELLINYTAGAADPSIELSTHTLSAASGNNYYHFQPPTQIFTVSNSGSTSWLNWTAESSGGVPWLSINPSAGSIHTSASYTDIVSAGFNVDGIEVGTYNDYIKVFDVNADNSPHYVSTTLTVAGSASLSDSASDIYKLSDTSTVSLSASLSGADVFKVSDFATNTLDVYPSISEIFKLSDSSSVSATFNPSASDIFSMADSTSVSASFTSETSDIFKLSDVLTPALTISLSGSDGFTLSDAATGGLSISSSGSDGFTLSESLSPSATFNPSGSDILILTDSISPILSATVSVSDIFDLSDVLTPALTTCLSGSDIIRLSDSLTITTAFNPSAADSLTMSDSITAIVSFITAAADQLILTDSSTFELTVNVNISDGFNLSEATTESVTFIVNLSDGFELTDEAIPVLTASLSGADIFVFSDAVSGTKEFSESLIDGFKLSETIDNTADFVDVVSEILELSDVSTNIHNIVESVIDGIKFGDISTGERIIHVKMVFHGEEQTYSFVVIPKSYIFTAENKQYSFKSGDKAYHFIINN